jgi:MYND finger
MRLNASNEHADVCSVLVVIGFGTFETPVRRSRSTRAIIMPESSNEVCAACGLPGRNHQPLLRCTRCKSVFYHDRQCQRAHYRVHRQACIAVPVVDVDPAAGQNDGGPSACSTDILPRRLEVVDIEGKGKAVRAVELMTKEQAIAVFEPLVPPVLVRQRRTTVLSTRCVITTRPYRCFDEFEVLCFNLQP